jgi:hypothetical protein
VLNVDLPPNLFDVISFALLAYMMIILVMYWRVDYLLWRDGSMMTTMNAIEEHLRSIKDVITDVEEFLKREVVDNVKYIEDQLGGMKVSVLDYRRSIAKTTGWVRFIIFGIHLAIPLGLGLFAAWLVAEGACAALSNLQSA